MEANGTIPPEFPPPPSAEREAPNLLQRMVRVFTSPREAFAGRLPATAWILPLVLVAAVQTTEGYLLRPMTVERMREMLVQSELSTEMRQQALRGLEKQTEEGILPWGKGFASGLGVAFLFALLLPSLLYWVGANFVFGGAARFWAAASVVGLSSLVFIPKTFITLPLKLHRQSLDIFTSLALLPIAEVGSKLHHALNVFDVFEIWFAGVAGIGLARVAGLRSGQGLAVAFTVWGFWALIRIALVLLLAGTGMGTLLGY